MEFSVGKSSSSLCFIDFGDCHNPDAILLDAGRAQLALSDNAYLSIKLYFFYLPRSVLCWSLGLLQHLMVWIKVSLNNDMTALAERLCPVVELPSRYPQVIIWSQLTWIAFSMLLHSDLSLHHSLSRRPSLALSLSSNICSSTIWWRNLIRAEGRRLERTRDTVKERSGVIVNGRQ